MRKPGDLVDRYVIEAEIGEGGMGRVYRALDPRLGRRVALKVLLAEDGPVRAEAAARMVREARAAAAFTHPNVVAIHDVGEVDGSPFIAMELVSGRTLRAWMGEGAASREQKLSWLIDVARGLAAAHRAGLVHRDIKPDNVMVTDDGAVKILDFGIARRAEADPFEVDVGAPTALAQLPSLTGEGQSLGTPQYMAPEQLRAEPVDGRCDQFAWGVMAWELFVGALPWSAAKTGAQLVAAVLAAPVRPLTDVLAGVPPALAEAVSRALSKDRDARFASMDDLVARLDVRSSQIPRPAVPADTSAIASAPTALAPAVTSGSPHVAAVAVTAADLLPHRLRRLRNPRTLLAICAVAAAVQLFRGGRGGHGASGRGEDRSGRDDDESREPPARGRSARRPPAPVVPDVDTPLAGLCDPMATTGCTGGTRAWCDPEGHELACCAPDLVAVVADGKCVCPPGGSDLEASTCPTGEPGPPGSVPRAEISMRALGPPLRACLSGADAASAATMGQVVAKVDLAADGRVFRARIQEGHVANLGLQTCELDVLRKARFSPPRGGYGSLRIPITFDARDAGPEVARGRHRCTSIGSCGVGSVAWCDTDEREVACCDKGLVAVGHDGMCECPPGGVSHAGGGCRAAKTTRAQWKSAFGHALLDRSDAVAACVEASDAGVALASPVDISVDPSGSVAVVRVTRAGVPEAVAQQCWFDAVRSIKLAPPPDGYGDMPGVHIGGR